MNATRCEEGRRPAGRLVQSCPYRFTGLPEEPTLTTYLPPGYDASDARHPLAIFFDGQNVFDDEGSHRGGWQLHRLLDFRACQGRRVPIVVGLHTAGWSRESILTPWAPEGLGQRTLDWVATWLVPALRRELRVTDEPVLLGGASLGGLLALYALGRHPDVFGRVVAMSPSIGAPGGGLGPIHGFLGASRLPAPAGRKLWIDAGQRECECAGIVHNAGTLAGALEDRGFRAHDDLVFVNDPGGSHDEASWKRRLPWAMDFVFGG
jgi:predicted alpha/beta superfamily hydrolase